jgi:hypothetical protein
MKALPATVLESSLDDPRAHAELEQLRSRDHVLLAPGDLADVVLDGGHFTSTAAPKPS